MVPRGACRIPLSFELGGGYLSAGNMCRVWLRLYLFDERHQALSSTIRQ